MARAFLVENECVYQGQYLISENGRFIMALNDQGTLEISDIHPNPGQADIIPGWDGRTFWSTKFTVFAQTDWRVGYPEYYENMFTEFMRKCNHTHPERPVTDLVGGHYFALKTSPEEQLPLKCSLPQYNLPYPAKDQSVKSLIVYDKNDKKIWHMTGPHMVSVDKEKRELPVALFLDNYGRAFIFNENKILWCSCPYCNFSPGNGHHWNEVPCGPSPIDTLRYGLYFRDEKFKIPAHFAKPASQTSKWVTVGSPTWGRASDETLGLGYSNPTWRLAKFYSFEEFWDLAQNHSFYKKNTGLDLTIPSDAPGTSLAPPTKALAVASQSWAGHSAGSFPQSESKTLAVRDGAPLALPEREAPESPESLKSLMARSSP